MTSSDHGSPTAKAFAADRRQVASGMAALLLGAVLVPPAAAQGAVRDLGGGVSYRPIGRWDNARLDTILTVDTPAFARIAVTYTPAKNAVALFRVTYPSISPDRGNRPVVLSGLVAVPETDAAALPLVSYQHGTVALKTEVPSFPEQSPEAQLMIAQFAGQGYALIGPDYLGMGESGEPPDFMVKAGQQQAAADLLPAATAVLKDMGKRSTGLFIAGWSQGGYVTMAMLERLESIGVPVTAAATAAAPADLWAALAAPIFNPRPADAPWITMIYGLLAFSYENHYGIPGLARSVIRDEAYEIVRDVYEQRAFDATKFPTSLSAMIRPEYRDPQFFRASALGRLLAANEVYRRVIKTPMRNYYGELDEVLRPPLARLPMEYQRTLGGETVTAISTGEDTHRGTFARAVPQWKAWFDGFQVR